MVVNPAAATAHDVSDSLAARAWRDAHGNSDMEPPPVDFEVVYEQSLADGARAVARAIQSFRCAAHAQCADGKDEHDAHLTACGAVGVSLPVTESSRTALSLEEQSASFRFSALAISSNSFYI